MQPPLKGEGDRASGGGVNSLSLAARRQSSSLKEGASPLCRCATSLPKGETSWTARKTKAFLFEEGGTAQAVTEGAAHEQVRIRANLMRILPICKTPSVFACGKSSSLEEGASPLCRCATSLPKGETSWTVRKNQKVIVSNLSDWSMCARTGYEMRWCRAGSQLTICKYTAQNGACRIWGKRGFRRYVM